MTRFFSVLSFSFLVLACSEKDDANCESYAKTQVNVISAPTVGVVNENLKFDLSFNAGNGCGSFDKIEEITTGTLAKKVNVFAKYSGCMCSHDAPTIHVDYIFRPTSAGNYSFTFDVENGKTETYTVKVN